MPLSLSLCMYVEICASVFRWMHLYYDEVVHSLHTRTHWIFLSKWTWTRAKKHSIRAHERFITICYHCCYYFVISLSFILSQEVCRQSITNKGQCDKRLKLKKLMHCVNGRARVRALAVLIAAAKYVYATTCACQTTIANSTTRSSRLKWDDENILTKKQKVSRQTREWRENTRTNNNNNADLRVCVCAISGGGK